ncbi:MAG: choice-of-anchor D domain-containing protein [Myxococcaceae bacterium]
MSARAAVSFALALAFLACGPTRTKTVHPQLVPPVDNQDFGAVPVLNEKVGQVAVLNVGRATLKVLSVHWKTEGGAFTIKSQPAEVETGGTGNIEVGFVPPLEGDYAATLVLETEDLENPLVEVALTGQGSTRAKMELDPLAIDFGRVAECSAAVKTLTIRSMGTADLLVQEIAFTEGTSDAFSFVGSTRTPATVKAVGANGLPGQIQLTVKYTAAAGAPSPAAGGIRIRGTDPESREVVVPLAAQVNRAPIPAIKPFGVGAPGIQVTLDGSATADPDGDDPLTYKWTLRQKPMGAATSIAAPGAAVTTMWLDPGLAGEYEVELSATDSLGAKSCASAREKIVATPAQKLLIEMFWNNPVTDVDLHVLRTNTTPVSVPPGDCFYANPRPDWGTAGDASDDPEFLRDALTGYGPELFGYLEPAASTYRIVAELTNGHLATNPASEVTVRIYEFGVVKGEFKKTLLQQGEFWAVADLEWPSGVITPLQ